MKAFTITVILDDTDERELLRLRDELSEVVHITNDEAFGSRAYIIISKPRDASPADVALVEEFIASEDDTSEDDNPQQG